MKTILNKGGCNNNCTINLGFTYPHDYYRLNPDFLESALKFLNYQY